MMRIHYAIAITSFVVAAATSISSASAQEGHAFFKGKTIRVVSSGAGGGYAEYARLLSRHMGRHLAGNPNFIVQAMPGAGGLIATNFLFAQAPKDGTAIGLVHPTAPLAPLFGNKAAKFDALKFNWLGSLDRSFGLCAVWYSSLVKTWSDMRTRTLIVGSTGAGAPNYYYPALLNKWFGTKIKVVAGFKGGTDIFLAMERGEIEGRCDPQLATLKRLHPDWLPGHKISVPILISEKRSTEFPNTPSIFELAKDEQTQKQLKLFFITQEMARPMLLPPGVPVERVVEVRAAFEATLADPAFRADAANSNLPLDPMKADDLLKVLTNAYASPAHIIEAVREIVGEM